jgi:hypothetical protein
VDGRREKLLLDACGFVFYAIYLRQIVSQLKDSNAVDYVIIDLVR